MNISVNLDALKNDERETLLRLIGKANKPMKEEFVCIKQRKDKVTWEQLEEIIEAGKAKEFFGGKGSISVEMEGVGAVAFDIIGYDAEKLMDPGKHSMTLWMRDLLFEKMPFSAGCNSKWEDSDIRKYLQSDSFIKRFEPGFRKLLSPVYKDNGESQETYDVFFLLSKEELEGGYEYIKTEADRVKVDENGETDWHWTRSANRDGANNTWCVCTSGHFYNYSAYWANRFSPACVIAR
nr:MAG TPA: hypothetical protein [Caudoviricetes sp.]